MGVQHAIQAGGGDEVEQVTEIGEGSLPTVVIDATGSAKSMSGAFQFVGYTGRLVYVGITTTDVSLPDPLFHKREMMLLASRNAVARDFRRIIGLIEEGRIDTRPWITHRTDFDSLAGDFPSYTKPETGVIKAVVNVD